MPRFRFRFPAKFPVNIAATAAALVIGATSATAATHLVLATDSHPATSADAPPTGGTGGGEHGPGTTPTTVHRDTKTEPHPTTSTTVKPTTSTTTPPGTGDHHEPPYTYPTTSTTAKPTTSTTRPPGTEPHPTTSTTAKPTTSTPAPTTSTTTSPTTSPTTMSLECRTGAMDGQPAAYCWWSKSTAPNFHHYRLTRELVGTPRQEIFTTTNRDTYVYLDKGLQPGADYSYIVETYDADGHLIARSQPFHLTCCETAFPTK